jgi:hypothetical protein
MENSPTQTKPESPEGQAGEGLAAVPLFGFGDEMEFRRQFAVQFLASYAAAHFDDYCANSLHSSLEHLPVEDAEYLSGTTWRHWCATMPMKPNK